MDEREKAIEEMAEDILNAGVSLDGTDFQYGMTGDDHFHRLASKLYDAGYRKADEVRKETAREILVALVHFANTWDKYEGGSLYDIIDFARSYGVEEEE